MATRGSAATLATRTGSAASWAAALGHVVILDPEGHEFCVA